MKINATTSNSPLNGVSGSAPREAGATGAPRADGARGDVQLSAAARHLAALGDGHADIRAEHVRQIRDALAAGELPIDTARIADGLLDSMRDLLK